jgi:hypothetical protein
VGVRTVAATVSNPALLRQTYWPADSSEQRADKVARLVTSVQRTDFAVTVEVKRHQKKRSPEANAYLWGVVYPLLADASGYEKEELHYVMCCRFFGTKVVEVMGQRYERPVRTTTTNEDGELEWLPPGPFAELVDFAIREGALWYDVIVPPPSPKQVPRDERP